MSDAKDASPAPERDGSASDSFARRVLDGLIEGCQVIGRDFRYLYVNDAVAAQARQPRDQLLGRTMMEAFPGIDATEMFSVLRRCMDARTPEQMENEFTFPDGSKGWFELRFEPVPEGVAILSLDISSRKLAELRLRRSSRALEVISACNQALIRAADEATLFSSVCDIAVHRGGYRLAWIGLKGDGEEREVHPVAASGVGDGVGEAYTASLQIRWDESPRGRGPTGRAIRTGVPVATRHIGTDPDFEPWREKALELGYASSVALPFEIGGEVGGALNIYATEPDAFDDAERAVLEELAADLGYGIDALRARTARTEAESRYHALYENSLDAVLLTAPEGRTLAANPAACTLFDRTEAELCRIGRAGVVAPDDPRLHLLQEERAKTGRILGGLTLLRRDGTRFEAEISSAVFDTSDGPRASMIIRDVSARTRAEEALRASEERYRRLTENLPDLVWRTDAEGHVLFVNHAIERLLGYTPDEMRHKPMHEYVSSASLARIAALLDLAQRDASQIPYALTEIEYIHKDGSMVPGELHAMPVVDDDGRLCALEGVTRDVRERKKAEIERDELQAQLHMAQKLESVGRLAGGVAHDFNNLLTVILSYAVFAAEDLDPSDPLRADLVAIQQAGQRAADLTHQLLAFSRKQLLEPKVIDLNEVVRNIEGMLRRLLGEDVDIEAHLATADTSVLADPGQLEQVIMNLAVNARDAMPDGGKLTLETDLVELDAAYAQQHPGATQGRHVMLAVTDTGVGMSAETRERAFEPFFTTKGRAKGTGLGLSTAYGIVKQSGGSIRIDSEPGRGTTFEIHLPKADGPAAVAKPRRPSETSPGGETVLVVEDEEAVRKIATRILRGAGYEVLDATTGEEALMLCERHGSTIDLLLTDVVMPQMSGKEVAERLASSVPGLKVLYMSGYPDDAILHHGVLERGTHFIGKPFAAPELARKVREVLDGS